MTILSAFLVGGILCVIGQLIMDLTPIPLRPVMSWLGMLQLEPLLAAGLLPTSGGLWQGRCDHSLGFGHSLTRGN